jgi:hypothetical protein
VNSRQDEPLLSTRKDAFGGFDEIIPHALVMVVNYVRGYFPPHDLIWKMLRDFVAECIPRHVRPLLIGQESQAADVVGAKLIVRIRSNKFRQIFQLAQDGCTI